MSQIDTSRVQGRRPLKFSTGQELLADAERLARAEGAGTLRILGNWTLGQAFGHLAAWTNYPFDGYPAELRPPWFIKVILRLRKAKYLTQGLPSGVKIPNVAGGTAATEKIPTADGLSRLKRAWARLSISAPIAPNPIFGPMTHEEWIAVNLRHAELHLSFFLP